MGAGLIQLVATGVADLYLTGDPQITWFKIMYRRYTEFAMADHPIRINADLQLGTTHLIKIPPIADKLNRVTLVVDIPNPVLRMIEPSVQAITDIVGEYDIKLTFNPIKRLTEKVTYTELFNDTDTSLGYMMVKKVKKLNKIYNGNLDALEYIRNMYSVQTEKRSGKYIALKASTIDFANFGENTDPSGYLLLTHEKSREILMSTDKVVNLDETSFVYRKKPTLGQTTWYQNTLPTNTQAIDQLAVVYPRSMRHYTQIKKIDDLNQFNDKKTVTNPRRN